MTASPISAASRIWCSVSVCSARAQAAACATVILSPASRSAVVTRHQLGRSARGWFSRHCTSRYVTAVRTAPKTTNRATKMSASLPRTGSPRRRGAGPGAATGCRYCPEAVSGMIVRANGSGSAPVPARAPAPPTSGPCACPTCSTASADPVAGAGHREDHLRFTEPPPQGHHRHSHHVGEGVGVLVPRLLQQLLRAHRGTSGTHQHLQHRELLG